MEYTWEVEGDTDAMALATTFVSDPDAMSMSFQKEHADPLDWIITALKDKRKARRKVPFIELAVEHGLASPDTADKTYRRALEKMRKALSK